MPVRLQEFVVVEERSHWDMAGPIRDCFMRERKLDCGGGEEREGVKREKMERKVRTEPRGGMVRCGVLWQWSACMVDGVMGKG